MLSRAHAWFLRHKNKIGTIAIGHTAKKAEEVLFDWLIYGVVVLWATHAWGSVAGSLVAFALMTPLSALACFLYLKFYDWAQVDWFGFELIKELRDEEAHESWWRHLFHRLLRRGGVPAFLALSLYTDPFMTTIYFRHKSRAYRGLDRREWIIFWTSVVVSNAYWTLRWTVILSAIVYIWTRIVLPIFS